jgi:hypothetical protein
VAPDGVPNLSAKLSERVRFREDRRVERTRRIPAFGRSLDSEDKQQLKAVEVVVAA